MVTTPKTDGNPITIRVDDATRDALQQVALKNDRSLSAEVRRAIRRYLETEAEAA
jgi:predicted transcriptional regulator